MDESLDEVLADLNRQRRTMAARAAARRPKRIGSVLTDVVQLRGYARVQAQRSLSDAWSQILRDVLPALAGHQGSRIGAVRRGVIDIWVDNSTMNQELIFSKREILKRFRELAPDRNIRDFRVRVGKVQ